MTSTVEVVVSIPVVLLTTLLLLLLLLLLDIVLEVVCKHGQWSGCQLLGRQS